MKSSIKMAVIGALAASALSASAFAQEGSDWLAKERFQLRGRIIDIAADGDGHVEQNGLKTDVRHQITPEFDVTYFFTENVAAELIAATAKHEIDAGSINLGEAWILPPTLTLQYHFTPEKKFSPYIGAGLNYSMFYGEDDGNGVTGLDVDGGFGYAVQAGFDYWMNENWGLNLDVKYVDLDVDVDVDSAGTSLNADDVGLDPFIIGAGVSYRF